MTDGAGSPRGAHTRQITCHTTGIDFQQAGLKHSTSNLTRASPAAQSHES
jgi:hypothetical protein